MRNIGRAVVIGLVDFFIISFAILVTLIALLFVFLSSVFGRGVFAEEISRVWE